MRGDLTSVPLNDTANESIVNVEIVVNVIKKLILLLVIYSIGYYGFSTLWAWSILFVLVFDGIRTTNKTERLQVARAVSLGYEKEIILNTFPRLPAWVKFTDIEKVEWLNTTLKQIWQQVNEYTQDLVPKILEPAIQGYVSDFKFNHVVLGNIPLRIDGIKVYEPQDKRKIVMDLDISYVGDCYVTFQTYRFTGGIRDIQLHGRLRVVLTPLISRIPFIGGVQVYFMNPPHVDFDLIKITQILDIPGIRNKIKSTTMKVINSMFLYPNAYSLNLSHGVNVAKLAVFRTEGILRVHVVEAKNLVNKDIIGKSDPYVVLTVGSIKVETPVIQNSLNPKWDFWCEFEIVPNSELKIEVWDHDEGSKDDFLGHAKVDIAEVAKIIQFDMPIPLQGIEKGTIYLRLTWLSLSNNYKDLEIAIKETELLSTSLHTSMLMIYLDSSLNLPLPTKMNPNPFVVLEVENQIKQTDPENNTCAPIWDKGFTFLLRDPKKSVLNLRIHDDETKKTIGEVSFKVDNLQNEPRLELRRHTFFFNHPFSEASICCSMKLRILKNGYVKEKNDNDEEAKPKKMLVKQESNESTKSKLSSQSSVTSENGKVVTETLLENEEVSKLGQIKVSLSYSQQRQRLVVNVNAAKLPQKCDSYVKLTLQTDKIKTTKKTRTCKSTPNPVYNEQFEFLISKGDFTVSILTLEVKFERRVFDIMKSFLGQTIIALTKCDNLVEPFTEWFNLNGKKDAHVYHLIK